VFVGISSGFAGEPAAMLLSPSDKPDSNAVAGRLEACDVVASMPVIVGAGEASARESLPFAATVVPGIGLGSIAGLASVCAAIAAAASLAGAGDPARAGLCNQPRS